jgi:hypothetical protein
MPKRSEEFSQDALLKELTNIRRLLMALLVRDGVNSEEMGTILGLHPVTVRNMFPFRKIKKQRRDNG